MRSGELLPFDENPFEHKMSLDILLCNVHIKQAVLVLKR